MAGDYVLTPSMTLEQIIDSLKTGKVMQEAAVKIAIPEGIQLREIAYFVWHFEADWLFLHSLQ